jgi:hypothetical protein
MKRFAMVLIGLALLLPGTALAQSSSTCQAYNPQLCDVNGTTTTRTDGTASDGSAAATLPFTGLDVALLLAGGSALMGAGLVVRRLSRQQN